jgi:hypothetical protein
VNKLVYSIPGYDLPIDAPNGVPTGGSNMLSTVGKNAMVYVFGFALILAIILVIMSGIQWITSAGDKQKIAAARSRLIYTFVGLILILVSFVIIQLLGNLFSVNLFGSPT